jgi:hypothetical protein
MPSINRPFTYIQHQAYLYTNSFLLAQGSSAGLIGDGKIKTGEVSGHILYFFINLNMSRVSMITAYFSVICWLSGFGTVEAQFSGGWWSVTWDADWTKTNIYRWGAEGAYDLEYLKVKSSCKLFVSV